MKKFNLTVKEIMKINDLFEISSDLTNPLVISKEGKNDVYIMNKTVYDTLKAGKQKDIINRNKEIEIQSAKKKK